ncbi:hypothetical protein [Fodinicola feengrottensis]|uniref:Uncharacterized protein n=1 Tax=Fodinicola feengrottensis TaxID=435914 RepID=A0ABP4V9Q6_9ACTN|nr:hypothetical protein [Fodinicola feengrottensis]
MTNPHATPAETPNDPPQAGNSDADCPRSQDPCATKPPHIPRPRNPIPRRANKSQAATPRKPIPSPEEWAREQVKNAPPRSLEWARGVARIYGLTLDNDMETESGTDSDT